MVFRLTRRHLLKSAAATAAVSLAMPAVITHAQSRTLNITGNESSIPLDIRERFSAETGTQINFRSTTDASQLFNLIAAEGEQRQTDLSIIPGNRMYPFVAANYVEPIDESLLPNMDKLTPTYLSASSNFINEQRYGLPMLSYFGLVTARQGAITEADLDNLDIFFSDKYAGRITMRPGSALLMAMFNLGLQDAWFDFDGDAAPVRAMFEQVRPYVIERKNNLRKWYETSAEVQQLFIGAEVDGAFCFPDGAIPLIVADTTITGKIPRQGIWGYTANYAFFKNSPNREIAYEFVNYLLGQPQAGASMSNHSGALSTFIDATSGLDETKVAAMTFADEDVARVRYLDIRGADDTRYQLLDEYTAGLREA